MAGIQIWEIAGNSQNHGPLNCRTLFFVAEQRSCADCWAPSAPRTVRCCNTEQRTSTVSFEGGIIAVSSRAFATTRFLERPQQPAVFLRDLAPPQGSIASSVPKPADILEWEMDP